MSNVLTEYAIYEIKDHTGADTVSAYSLDITPLTFVPKFRAGIINEKIVWNFGDGTESRELSPKKVFAVPGVYTIEMFVFDCSGETRLATFSASVTITDFINNTFDITSNIESISAGDISPEIVVKSYSPAYQPMQDILFEIENSNTENYFQLDQHSYTHLDLYNTILGMHTFQYNHIGEFEYIEIDKITFDTPSTIYAKIVDGEVIATSVADKYTVVAGTSAEETIYYKDDKVSSGVSLSLSKDPYTIVSTDSNNIAIGANTLSQTLSCKVVNSSEPVTLSITSNGLDGEGGAITMFDINEYQLYEHKIPFVIKGKTVDGFTFKSVSDIMTVDDILLFQVGTELSSSLYEVEVEDNTLQDNQAYIRGTILYTGALTEPLSEMKIVCNCTINGNNIAGETVEFTIYPQNAYDVYKHNEDYDLTETIKSLRFQEILLDNNVFFDDFIGGAIGDADADYNAIGKVIYERISNFTDNNINISTMNIASQVSYSKLLDDDIIMFDRSLFKYPVGIERIVNMFVCNKAHLFGTSNTFNENFNMQGVTTKDEYGTNIGYRLDTETYQISAGTDIISFEKFSGIYTKLNTMQPPRDDLNVLEYSLSAYNTDWGWGLVLPASYTQGDLKTLNSLYEFYSYVDIDDNTKMGGMIDFDNDKTLLDYNTSEEDLYKDGGVVDIIIQNALINALDL